MEQNRFQLRGFFPFLGWCIIRGLGGGFLDIFCSFLRRFFWGMMIQFDLCRFF